MKLDTDLSVYEAKKMRKKGLSETLCDFNSLTHFSINISYYQITVKFDTCSVTACDFLLAHFCHQIQHNRCKGYRQTGYRTKGAKIFQGIINIMLHYSSKI